MVDTDVAWPNGLTVDWQDMELYWTDAKANVIEAIGLDGLHRRRVITGKDSGKEEKDPLIKEKALLEKTLVDVI